MPKKAKKKKVSVDTSETTSIIKLRLSPVEAKRVRVAAALEGKRPGIFAKDAVLKHADALIAKGFG